MPRKQKKYHYIYKTTNVLNNKFYIGMHSTDNLDDGYVGSGKRLWYSINKHGKENHKTEILEFLFDRKSLKKREEEIVNKDLLDENLCMNLACGGSGGFEHLNDVEYDNPTHSLPHMKMMSACGLNARLEKLKHLRATDPEWHADLCTKISTRLREEYANGKIISGFRGKLHSKKTKEKIGAKNSSNQSGINNSQYGTCWVYSEIEKINKKIDKTNLFNYLNRGWKQGRKMKF